MRLSLKKKKKSQKKAGGVTHGVGPEFKPQYRKKKKKKGNDDPQEASAASMHMTHRLTFHPAQLDIFHVSHRNDYMLQMNNTHIYHHTLHVRTHTHGCLYHRADVTHGIFNSFTYVYMYIHVQIYFKSI
jgi:hypothetical protein